MGWEAINKKISGYKKSDQGKCNGRTVEEGEGEQLQKKIVRGKGEEQGAMDLIREMGKGVKVKYQYR